MEIIILLINSFQRVFFRAEGGASGWDSAVSEASEIYGKNWKEKGRIERTGERKEGLKELEREKKDLEKTIEYLKNNSKSIEQRSPNKNEGKNRNNR